MARKTNHDKYYLNPQSTVQYLSIVCYDEQLLDGWEQTKDNVQVIRRNELVVVCIRHTADNHECKVHYHFVVLVCKKPNGKQNTMHVYQILHKLGIHFRSGVDDGLFRRNVQRLDSEFIANIRYELHQTRQKQDDEFDFDDLYSNLDIDELRIYLQNDGNVIKNMQIEIEKTILDRINQVCFWITQNLRLQGLFTVNQSDYAGYESLDIATKQRLLSEILHDNSYKYELFVWGKWSLQAVTMQELMLSADYGTIANKIADNFTKNEWLINGNGVVMMTDRYNYVPLVDGLYLDLAYAIADMQEQDEITEPILDEVLDEVVDKQLSTAFMACKDYDKDCNLTVGDTIVEGKNEHEGVRFAYLSDESKQAIFDVAFGDKMSYYNAFNGLNGVDFAKEYIDDMDDLMSYYNIIGGTIYNYHNNTKEFAYLIQKDNGTYVDITVGASAKFDKYVNRFGNTVKQDNTVYRFAKVKFAGLSNKLYYYLCDDSTRIDDVVEVPANNDVEMATVVDIESYTRANAPYNVDRCSYVLQTLYNIHDGFDKAVANMVIDDDDYFV